MEQLDQLKTMRDDAKKRLEEAIAAIEKSPDAKLVNSLTSLIDDLEESLGLKNAPAKKTTAAKKADDDVSDSGAAKAVEGAEVEPLASDDDTTSGMTASSPSGKADDEMSLEDSLEAELLGADLGKP